MLKKTKLILTGFCTSALIAGLFSAVGIGYYFSQKHDSSLQKVDLRNDKQVRLTPQLDKYELLKQTINYADIINHQCCFNLNRINEKLYSYLQQEIARICGINLQKDYLNLIVYYSLNFFNDCLRIIPVWTTHPTSLVNSFLTTKNYDEFELTISRK